MFPETYFYTCVTNFSKFEHPAKKILSPETYLCACVSEYMKHVVYILTVKLFTFTDTKFSTLVWNCYWKIDVHIGLKLDKPVCDILKRDIAVDSELLTLSFVCSNMLS